MLHNQGDWLFKPTTSPSSSIMGRDMRWVRIPLGLFYFMAGAIKLYPFHRPAHNYLAMKFVEYAVVFPTAPLGLTPDPWLYLTAIGVSETLMGLLLAFSPSVRVRHYSCLGLMVIMVGATQTVICNQDYADLPNPVICFCALLWVLRKESGGRHGATASVGAEDIHDADQKRDHNLNHRVTLPLEEVSVESKGRSKSD